MNPIEGLPVDLSSVTSWQQVIVAVVIGVVILACLFFVSDLLHRRLVRSKVDEVKTDLKAEMKTNHGSTSLGNAIDRQTETLGRIESRLLLTDARLDRMERRLDTVEDTMGK